MPDPLGLIGDAGPLKGVSALRPTPPVGDAGKGPSFGSVLKDEIAQVNEMQRGAQTAVEDYLAGDRKDVETVLMATEQADTAFQMLLQVRNKVMDAYEEVKQLRV